MGVYSTAMTENILAERRSTKGMGVECSCDVGLVRLRCLCGAGDAMRWEVQEDERKQRGPDFFLQRPMG